MQTPQTDSMLKQVMSDILVLQDDELEMVAALIEKIKASRPSVQSKTRRPSVALMRAEAKRRAAELGDLSHEELVQRFIDATDKIRAEAIEKDVAIEGEWEGD